MYPHYQCDCSLFVLLHETLSQFLISPDLIGCTRHLNIYSSITTAVPIEEEDEEDEDENLLFDDEYESSEETETDSLSSEGECEDECCFECKNRRHLALLDSLPPQVVRGRCR